ncbi:MAG TPA: hypothetical protein VIU12_07230 [Chryseolinea sp.]
MKAIVLVAVFATLRFLLLTPLHAQLLKEMHPSGFARITINVIHEDSSPVVEAKVGVGFNQTQNYWRDGHKFATKEIVTDANGIAIASGETTTGWITYGASKDGYYRTFGEELFLKRKGDRYEPWNLKKQLILKPILNPIPLYARKVQMLRIPVTGQPVGYDLIASDWIVPQGKGSVSDLTFTLQRKFEHVNKPFEASLMITFANDGDGIQPTIASPRHGSELRLPHYAPEGGYDAKLIKSTSRPAVDQMIIPASKDTLNYFFRVRTRKDGERMISAYYGKIDGDIDFDIINSDTALLFFTYYLNPNPNDRNMEFDPKRNLFRDLSWNERVTAP